MKLYTLYFDPNKTKWNSYLITDSDGNYTTTLLDKDSLEANIEFIGFKETNVSLHATIPMTSYSPNCKELATFSTVEELFCNYPELLL